jgi:hypothetical protein
LASALLDDRLSAAAPQQCPDSEALPWQARKLYGRWLAVRRLRLMVPAEVIADRAGVDAQTLYLLELGLAGDDLVDDERWSDVAMLLADGERDADFVMAALRGALGQAGPCAEVALDRVWRDLRALAAAAEPAHDNG